MFEKINEQTSKIDKSNELRDTINTTNINRGEHKTFRNFMMMKLWDNDKDNI